MRYNEGQMQVAGPVKWKAKAKGKSQKWGGQASLFEYVVPRGYYIAPCDC